MVTQCDRGPRRISRSLRVGVVAVITLWAGLFDLGCTGPSPSPAPGPGAASEGHRAVPPSDVAQTPAAKPKDSPSVQAALLVPPRPSSGATALGTPAPSGPNDVAVSGQVPPPEPNVPVFSVEKAEFDLGEISTNSKNTATFKLTNVGRATLDINDVIKCCGANVQLERPRLEPGQSSQLTVDYFTGTTVGQFKKELLVHSNDRAHPAVKLTILGKVVQRLVWKPLQLKLFLDKPNLGCADVVITALDGKPFSVKDCLSTGDCITVQYDPNAEAAEFVLKPTVDREKLLALAYAKGTLQLRLTRSDYEQIPIPFDLLPNYSVNPAQIIIFNTEPGRKETRKIQVLDNYVSENGQADLTVDSIASDSNSVSVTRTEKTKDGLMLYAEITPPVLEQGERSFSDEMHVKVKGGEELKVAIRLFYSARSFTPQGRAATH